jgi:hypothetical protein
MQRRWLFDWDSVWSHHVCTSSRKIIGRHVGSHTQTEYIALATMINAKHKKNQITQHHSQIIWGYLGTWRFAAGFWLGSAGQKPTATSRAAVPWWSMVGAIPQGAYHWENWRRSSPTSHSLVIMKSRDWVEWYLSFGGPSLNDSEN